jgi:hypothetical protein
MRGSLFDREILWPAIEKANQNSGRFAGNEAPLAKENLKIDEEF